MPRILILLLALVMTVPMAACRTDRTAEGYAVSDKSLMSYNYAGVDALMAKAGKAVNKNTPMLVGTIGNVNNVETSSTLGRTISEQLSTRLAQKGYKVAEVKLRQGISVQNGGQMSAASSGEFLLSRDVRNISGEHKAGAVITGTYSVGADTVLVNLRLVDVRTGTVITGYDYVLPKTADVAAMTYNQGGKSSFFGSGWVE